MRILYLMQYFNSPDGAYGTRTYEFARRLSERGHEVRVISSNVMMPQYRNIKRVTHVEIDGIHCVFIPSTTPYAAGISFRKRLIGYFQFNLSAFYWITRFPADVIYVSSPPLPISIPGIWARFWHRAPMIFEVRDLWPEMPIAVGALNNRVLRELARALEWIAYYASTHIIALSPGMAEGVAQRGIGSDRITVIPNSCDISFFDNKRDPAAIREKLGLSEDARLVVYAGAFGLLNDVDYLVDVAQYVLANHHDVHFLVVGDGVNKRPVIERAAQAGVLDNNFHIWDAVPKSSMPDILATSNVVTSLFIPLESMWKNSANKFFDGLAAGKPLAINYGGWHADLLRETGAGTVMEPGNPRQGAQQLIEFIDDPERLKKASEAAMWLARSRFNRDHMADKIEDVLFRAVGRNKKSAQSVPHDG